MILYDIIECLGCSVTPADRRVYPEARSAGIVNPIYPIYLYSKICLHPHILDLYYYRVRLHIHPVSLHIHLYLTTHTPSLVGLAPDIFH